MTQSTAKNFDLAAAMKGQQWERAKGELRALVALQGSYHSGGPPSAPPSHEMTRLKALGAKVEAFIKKIEGEGLAD